MTSYEVKNALERIHANEYPAKRTEFFTKGFQINRCYVEDWDEITAVFRKYKMEVNSHGPIITITQKNYVNLADKITEMIKHDEKIRSAVSIGIYSGKGNFDTLVDGKIFITILRILPSFCQKYAEKKFVELFASENVYAYFERIMEMRGTIKTTENEINGIIEEIVSGA